MPNPVPDPTKTAEALRRRPDWPKHPDSSRYGPPTTGPDPTYNTDGTPRHKETPR